MKKSRKIKIYTKGGDKGQTSLFGGKRIAKDAPRIAAIGALDELNAATSLAISSIKDKKTLAILVRVQNTLFDIGAELANPQQIGINTNKLIKLEQSKIDELEKIIDQVDARLKPLANFILPSGSEAASRLHLARSIIRRTEREIVELSRKENVNPVIIAYLNRLSDLFFVLARDQNRQRKIPDTLWK